MGCVRALTGEELPFFSQRGELILRGCNYHTAWQKDKGMRFVLSGVYGSRVRLTTRRTGSNFLTQTEDLILIRSGHNIKKAAELLNNLGLSVEAIKAIIDRIKKN